MKCLTLSQLKTHFDYAQRTALNILAHTSTWLSTLLKSLGVNITFNNGHYLLSYFEPMKLEVVYKGKYKAGELSKDDEGYHFIYEEAFLNDNTTRPISMNMPKSQKEYHSQELFHFFQSILSEGENRKKMCKALGIDVTDDWGLLMHSCAEDTIGAITVKILDD